jgi:hypothetical protein
MSSNVASCEEFLTTTQLKPERIRPLPQAKYQSQTDQNPLAQSPYALPSAPLDFMQSESTELPQNTSNPSNSPDLANASQYGLPTNQLPAEGPRGASPDGNTASAGSSAVRSAGDAELHRQFRRLSLDDSSETRPRPSFQRISEYESALSPSPPRKPKEGPGFTVVRKQGSTLSGPQLENFPNGNYPTSFVRDCSNSWQRS